MGRKNIELVGDKEMGKSTFPIALVILLVCGGIKLVPNAHSLDPFYSSGADSGQLVRNIGFLLSYLVSFAYLLVKPIPSIRLLGRVFLLLFLTGYACFSVLWSASLSDVMHFCAHAVGLILVANATAQACAGSSSRLYASVYLSAIIVLIISTFVALVFPDYGVSYLVSHGGGHEPRWNGITSHPNTLGQFGVIAVWAGLAWRGAVDGSLGRFFILLGVVFALIVTAAGCQSMTSTIVAMLIISLFIFIKKEKFHPLVVFGYLFLACILLVSFAGVLLNMMGRDMTFTGRTHLWESAFNFFAAKPILGWGFDGGLGLKNGFSAEMQYTSFHNGFLQVLVLGGSIGFGVFVALMLSMSRAMVRLRTIDPVLAFIFFTLIIGLCVHNLTESTFFASGSPVWVTLICLWFHNENILLKQRAQQTLIRKRESIEKWGLNR